MARYRGRDRRARAHPVGLDPGRRAGLVAPDTARGLSLAQGGDGTDNLSEPWAVPLQEARLSTFLAANRNVARVEDASTDTADAFLSGQITRPARGLLNLRNLAGDKQVDATAQRQFTPVRLLGLPRQQLDQLAQAVLLATTREGRPEHAAAAAKACELGGGGCRPPSSALAPHVTRCRCAPWST